MPILPSRPGRQERILGIGAWGCGKSYNILQWLEFLIRSGSDLIPHLVNTDADADVMLDSFPLVADRAKVHRVHDWKSLGEATEGVRKATESRPQDWLVIDMVDPAWDWCQQYYTERIFRKGMEEFFMDYRAKMEQMKLKVDSANPLDGWKDWSVINKLYHAWAQPTFYRLACNLYCAAKVEAVDGKTDDGDTKLLFGAHGVKPKGQKHLAHGFHTVLWFRQPKTGIYTMTTIKDRGREMMMDETVKNFALQYFMKRGGWKSVTA